VAQQHLRVVPDFMLAHAVRVTPQDSVEST
jgi:hypothetical protein